MKKEKEYLLTICIPSYDNVHVLSKNIQNIQGQLSKEKFKWELIIGLNFSSNEDKKFIKNFEGKNIKIFAHSLNLGFTENLLFITKQAAGKVILFLGDDDFPEEGLFDELNKFILKNDDFCGVSFLPLSCEPNILSRKNRETVYTFMRSGSFMGAVVCKAALDLPKVPVNGQIYPQIEFLMSAYLKFGLTQFNYKKSINVGEGLPLEMRFSDKMNRPSDYGVLERIAILKRLLKFGLSFKEFILCLSSLLQWADDLAFVLKKKDMKLYKFFCRSILMSVQGIFLLVPILAIKLLVRRKANNLIQGLI
jgi:glycosyltransferase involved in cell wall biosynthesis